MERGTIFYNPMRIMLGSIAMVDDDDEPGITSPDYVVVRGRPDRLHPRWFYYWFRSTRGRRFIEKTSRGAVRERILFTRLQKGHVELPTWKVQAEIARKLRAIRNLETHLKAELQAIQMLPNSLLLRAFVERYET